LISYFASAAKDMRRNTVAVARRCATLIAVTDVAAVHTGKITGRQYDTKRSHSVHNHAACCINSSDYSHCVHTFVSERNRLRVKRNCVSLHWI
jgi:hypothetical protein